MDRPLMAWLTALLVAALFVHGAARARR